MMKPYAQCLALTSIAILSLLGGGCASIVKGTTRKRPGDR